MIIAQGLSAGEEVVIDGQLRLTPGAQVSIARRGEGGGRGEGGDAARAADAARADGDKADRRPGGRARGGSQ